jgi:alpha-beta hydrolase superfamily lysophospholipase
MKRRQHEHEFAVEWDALDIRKLLMAIFLLVQMGCRPVSPSKEEVHVPQALHSAHFVTSDGATVPVRIQMPPADPLKAIVLAVHGFNDYGRAFESVGAFLKSRGIGVIAYDQRGFGMSGAAGHWAGSHRYPDDLAHLVFAVRDRYPGSPIYLLGESMGAAVVIASLNENPSLPVAGAILSAPAVWSRDSMPWYQVWVLESVNALFPDLELTGSGLKVQASDNIGMLRALGRDPWVIKATRVDAIHGLADLMDTAQQAVSAIRVPLLILYGGHDQIIPADPVLKMLQRVSGKPQVRVAFYPEGYHLLLRDLEAHLPLQDLAAWIATPEGPLPSGCEVVRKDVIGEGRFAAPAACVSGRSGGVR